MDMPSSAPIGGLIDRSVAGLVHGPAEAALDQPKYLHHAGSPWFLALTALGVVFGDIGTSPLYAFQVALDRHRPCGAGCRRRARHRLADFLGADGDGVAEICDFRAARRQ